MRIAVTYQDGNVFQHFGHTEFFKIYDVEDGKITKSEVVSTDGVGHEDLVRVLYYIETSVLICGGLGQGAFNALNSVGIEVVAGASGNTDEVVKAYLEGNLQSTGVNCDHHGHEEGHTCGSNGCGSNGCGSNGCHN